MTNEVKLFNNDMFGEIQVVTFKDQPMFVAKEIAMILGYSATSAMNKIIDEEDKFKHTNQKGNGVFVNQSLINKKGLIKSMLFLYFKIFLYLNFI
jgi:prophage antirepressor-like protein